MLTKFYDFLKEWKDAVWTSCLWLLAQWKIIPERWRWGLTGFAFGAFLAFTLPRLWKVLKRKVAPPFPEIEDAAEVFRRRESQIKKNETDLAKSCYRFWRSVSPRIALLNKKDDPWPLLLDLIRVRHCFESVGVPDSEKEAFAEISKRLAKRFKRGGGICDGYDIPP
ncbi:MAG: hypothetical protein DME22_24735 [Verrucomicrobia bacterium]|nr:MAG: hypothetical protein DME22_24735 [Verrucomicrobiota bacterium]PYJ99329.1 MAG: hypothetical protein DME23_09835 [Verrucomicrobiota bacterium]